MCNEELQLLILRRSLILDGNMERVDLCFFEQISLDRALRQRHKVVNPLLLDIRQVVDRCLPIPNKLVNRLATFAKAFSYTGQNSPDIAEFALGLEQALVGYPRVPLAQAKSGWHIGPGRPKRTRGIQPTQKSMLMRQHLWGVFEATSRLPHPRKMPLDQP